MNESLKKWFSDLESDLFSEHDINCSLEEVLKGESSLLSELRWKSLSLDSDFIVAGTSNNNMRNAPSLEENTQQHISSEKLNVSTTVPNIPKNGRTRNSSQTQDHILAERKRREKLSKMFIALSAIIPGLKKTEKLYIISNTIDYVKYLQNRVRDLEEQNEKMKSAMCFKSNKPNVTIGGNISGICDGLDRLTFPKVDASISGEDVIIRVICDKREGIVTKLLSKLATHNLSIVCSNVLPFGNSNLNISFIVKVEREFSMPMDDLVKILSEDLLKFYNCNNN